MGMSQKLPVNGFKWANDLSRINEDFIKNYSQNSDIGYFLEVVLIKIYHFYRKEKNTKSRKTCLWYRTQRKLRHSQKSFKTSTKSWINTKICVQSSSI